MKRKVKTMIKIDMNDLDKFFVKGELIPAICYEVNTKTVLMLAYMNKESLKKTLETGYTWFWSRSRQEYWNKGATSGHVQKVVSIYGDCDNDTLLVNVEQTGVACHTGSYSCFFNEIYNSEQYKSPPYGGFLSCVFVNLMEFFKVSDFFVSFVKNFFNIRPFKPLICTKYHYMVEQVINFVFEFVIVVVFCGYDCFSSFFTDFFADFVNALVKEIAGV